MIVESPAKARTLGRFLGRDFPCAPRSATCATCPGTSWPSTRRAASRRSTRCCPRGGGCWRSCARPRATRRPSSSPPTPTARARPSAGTSPRSLAGPRRRFRRVAFHEITPRAVEEAFRTPREIDARRVDAQQARRILDRLVGYSLSPLLWQKVAGRALGRPRAVGGPAHRLRARAGDRGFVPEEHWTFARGSTPARRPCSRRRSAGSASGRRCCAARPRRAAVVGALASARFRVASVAERQRRRAAGPALRDVDAPAGGLPPAALRRQEDDAARAASLRGRRARGRGRGRPDHLHADRLDARRAGGGARGARARRAAVRRPRTLRETPNEFRSPRGAQEAHEAIRPTDLARTPDSLAAGSAATSSRSTGSSTTASWPRRWRAPSTTSCSSTSRRTRRARRPARPRTCCARRARPCASGASWRARGDPGRGRGARRAWPRCRRSGPARTLALVKVDTEQRFTRAAAALHGGEPREGARALRDRAALDLRGDPGDLLDRDYVTKAKGRLAPTALGFSVVDLLVERFPRADEHALHGRDGGGARRDRGRPADAARGAHRVLATLRARRSRAARAREPRGRPSAPLAAPRRPLAAHRPLRRVRGLPPLPAAATRARASAVQRGRRRRARGARAVLRLQPLPRLPLHVAPPAARRELPRVRPRVPVREADEARRPRRLLRQRELPLPPQQCAAGRAGPAAILGLRWPPA